MPQLDVTYYGPQLFWLVVCFAVLVSGMRYLVLPRLQKIFDQRQKALDDKLDQIQALEQNAEKLADQSKAQLKQAQEDSKKELAVVKESLSQELIDLKHTLSEDTTTQLHQANEVFKKEVADMARDLNAQIPSLATQTLKKLLGGSLSEDEIKKVMEQEKINGLD